MALDDKTRSLIKRYIQMSDEDLASVPLLMEKGFYRAAVNRAFYSCYHMVNGALLSQGVDSRYLNKKKQNFVFRTIFTFDNPFIEREYVHLYEGLQKLRRAVEKGDTDVVMLEVAEKAYQDAQQFVERLR